VNKETKRQSDVVSHFLRDSLELATERRTLAAKLGRGDGADQPRNGRVFFEGLVADNLDLGRQAKAHDVNRRLLDHEHVGQGCVIGSPAFERIARPSLVDGRRAPALTCGDPRVQALAGALATPPT
jgi:hypothetical protein